MEPINFNRVKTLVKVDDTSQKLVGKIGDDELTIAEVYWDGTLKSVYLQFEIDLEGKATSVGNNNSVNSDHADFSYRNSVYAPKSGTKFYISNTLGPKLHNDFFLKNGSIFLDEANTLCYSFDFNITVNSNNTYQLLSSVVLVEV